MRQPPRISSPLGKAGGEGLGVNVPVPTLADYQIP